MRKPENITISASSEEVQPPKISAIVSAYNSEQFIRGCLDDLLNQSLYKKGKLEIIVVVSGSEENEKLIVDEYLKTYSNIKLISTEGKETIYKAWNRGINAAVGKYITNANTDDRHKEDALEQILNVFETNNKVDVVYADVYNTRIMNDTFDSPSEKTVTKWIPFDKDLILFGCFLGPQPMWKKSLHEKFGMFDESLKVVGDYEFWLRISREAKFYHLDEVLGLYFYSEDSAEHRNKIQTKEENRIIQKNYIINNVSSLNDVKRIREKLEMIRSAKDGEQYYIKAKSLIEKREAGLRIEIEMKEFEQLYPGLSENEKLKRIEQFYNAASGNAVYIDSDFYLTLINKLKESNINTEAGFNELFESAVTYLNHNKFQEAYDELLLCIESYPRNKQNKNDTSLYDLYLLTGNTALILNDFQNSKHYFEKALKENSKSSKACFGLAELFFIEKNFESAKMMYEWAVANDRNDISATDGLKKVNAILGYDEKHCSLVIEQSI